MPLFNYAGISNTGAPVSGEREAESAYQLIANLQAEGIYAHHVHDPGAARGFQRQERPLEAVDLSLFTGQLAALIQGGMPLAPALGELALESRNGRLRTLLDEARRHVEGGHSLEEVLLRRNGTVPALYISLIRIGERTGNLPGVLLQLSAFAQRRLALVRRIQTALAYPVILFGALVLFLGVFVPVVVGQFEELFYQMGGTLPLPTRLLLLVGGWVQSSLNVIPLLILLYFAYRVLLHTGARNTLGRIRETILLATPVAGRFYESVLEARFFRALGMLLENGAPILESLCLAASATGSARITAAGVHAAQRAAQGESVSQTLKDTGIATRSHVWMLNQAESTGTLPQSLLRLADNAERTLELEQHSLCAALGPIFIIVAGIVAGISIVGCFLPIFQIANLVHG